MKQINSELTQKARGLALEGTTIREIAKQLSISDNQA
jgi:orotate phosphoribosyltransferase-like protein